MITGPRPVTAPGLAIKMQSDSGRNTSLIVLSDESRVKCTVVSSTTGASREQTKSSDRFKVFLVRSMDEVSQGKYIRLKWAVLNFDISGMATLKTDKNARNVETIKHVGLAFSCGFIIEVCRLKPGVRYRNNAWLEIIGGNIADHGPGFIRVADYMGQGHQEANGIFSGV